MAAAIMRPLANGYVMQKRWTDGRPMPKVAAEFIKPNDRLTSFERLEIYNKQYWFRVLDSFYDDFPGLRAVLGDRAFDQLAHRYLVKNPSESFTLRNLGGRLVKFLERQPEWGGTQRRLALDMARLEWAHIEAFDNAQLPVLTADDLLDADAVKMSLKLQPYIFLLRVHHDVDDLLIELKQDAGLRSEASNAIDSQRKRRRTYLRKLRPQKEIHLVVHRYRGSVYYKRLEKPQFRLLHELQSGASLGDACVTTILSQRKNAPSSQDIKAWFEEWMSLGWFCRNV